MLFQLFHFFIIEQAYQNFPVFLRKRRVNIKELVLHICLLMFSYLQFGTSSTNNFVNMMIFVGSLRKIICPQESQFALQAFVQSMLFQKESCHLLDHLIWRQMETLKMTVVKQVFLPRAYQVTVSVHRQVLTLH